MKRVLIFSTYPVINPQHGGQKRLKAITDTYKEAGYEVKNCSIYDKFVYHHASRNDIGIDFHEQSAAGKLNPWTGDIICGEVVYKNQSVKKKVTRLITSFRPDIIHVEQPFIYIGLEPLLKDLNCKAKLVYGSQNIEGPMKREILERQGVPPEEIEEAVRITQQAEEALVKKCDLLVACTEGDVKTYVALGIEESKTVVARNGIERLATTAANIRHWRRRFAKEGVTSTALFVASAHPPSITGFIDVVGKGLGFLESNERIVIAGSVSDYFTAKFKEDNINIEDATFWLRAVPCGRVSEQTLGALLTLADVIILPITEGGGSNLKTAEALLANKKVVATSYALRSFEWAEKLPNVWIADTKEEFTVALEDALRSDTLERSKQEVAMVDKVVWDVQLKEFRERVAQL